MQTKEMSVQKYASSKPQQPVGSHIVFLKPKGAPCGFDGCGAHHASFHLEEVPEGIKDPELQQFFHHLNDVPPPKFAKSNVITLFMLLAAVVIFYGLALQSGGAAGVVAGMLLLCCLTYGALWARVHFNSTEVLQYFGRLEEQIEEGKMGDNLMIFSDELKLTWRKVFCSCFQGYHTGLKVRTRIGLYATPNVNKPNSPRSPRDTNKKDKGSSKDRGGTGEATQEELDETVEFLQTTPGLIKFVPMQRKHKLTIRTMEGMTDRDWKDIDVDITEKKAILRDLEGFKQTKKEQKMVEKQQKKIKDGHESPREAKKGRASVNPIIRAATHKPAGDDGEDHKAGSPRSPKGGSDQDPTRMGRALEAMAPPGAIMEDETEVGGRSPRFKEPGLPKGSPKGLPQKTVGVADSEEAGSPKGSPRNTAPTPSLQKSPVLSPRNVAKATVHQGNEPTQSPKSPRSPKGSPRG